MLRFSSADYDPNGGAGTDVKLLARIRFTDTSNCTPASCDGGPYTQPGTGTDFDFGPVPVDCVPNGDPVMPPGSDCNTSTTANAFLAGAVVDGKEASVQVFRIRITDSTNTLFQQQGLLIP